MPGTIRGYATAIPKRLIARFFQYLDQRLADIDHNGVLVELFRRTEISASYLAAIILANLIALLGLLMDSIAVIIGAMLISPLMGPIFSLGMSFSIGDLALSRRAMRNIGCSIALTVLIAALFTLVSPLKGPSHEILSRTQPNIYDLVIAGLAGCAGALALTTRRNYLFTTSGVAIATAVIPPLSVVGYGVGTWQPRIAWGGFLLFFTNLVAITISSVLIFHLLRFRGDLAAESRYPARRRFQILGAVLLVISIPLMLTLVKDIRKIRITSDVKRTLTSYLRGQQYARLTSVSVTTEKGGLSVVASLNTVKYLGLEMQRKIEAELSRKLGVPVSLEMEQVMVRSGEPRDRTASSTEPSEAATRSAPSPREMIPLRDGCEELKGYTRPFPVRDCSISYTDAPPTISVRATLFRDFPPSYSERRLLEHALENRLGPNLELVLDTRPLIPPIRFTDAAQPDSESMNNLQEVKVLLSKAPSLLLVIEIPKHAGGRGWSRKIDNLRQALVRTLQLPANHPIPLVKGDADAVRVKLMEPPPNR